MASLRSKCTRICLLGCVLLLATVCQAIHEDEQGLRDWIMRFTGNVRQAAVPPVPDPSVVYVLSEEGAVAALSLTPRGGVNLTWREVFSEAPLCVAASEVAVLAVDAKGSAYLLNPRLGFVETTFLLQRPATAPLSAKAVACSVVGDKVTVAMYDTATAAVRVYAFEITTEDEIIAPLAAIPFAEDVLYLRMGGRKYVWAVTSAGQTTQLDIEQKAVVSTLAGYASSVGPNGEVAVVTSTGVTATDGRGTSFGVPCTNCGVAHIINPADGVTVGKELSSLVAVKNVGDALHISFPEREIVLRVNAGKRHAYPLIAFTRESDDAVYALVKKADHSLVLAKDDGSIVWERFEGLSSVAATLVVEPPTEKLDLFHFNKQVLLVSRFGALYSVPLSDMGTKVEMITDFSLPLLFKLHASDMRQVNIKSISHISNGVVAIRCSYGVQTAMLFVNLASKSITEIHVFEDAVVVAPTYTIGKDLTLHGTLDSEQLFVYVAKKESGLVEGYSVSNTTQRATPAWTIQFPGKIVSHASGQNIRRTSVVNQLRVYPNNTGAELVEEVRHRYPTRNVAAIAYYEVREDELPTLVIAAVDTVTGSILATTRHANVEGSVKMVVVEHTVIYYFLDAEKMRYCFGVWEMFEEENGSVITKSAGATLPQVIASFFVKNDRTFSSRASRPPVVAVSTLGLYGGPLVDIGVTTSNGAIARKSIVLVFESGRVAVVELRHLLAGGQMPFPNVEKKLLSHVIIPSTFLATHKYRLALPHHVTTEPTNLESSCHVVVTGLDLFYVRSSTGKPFDLLNSDYNKPALVSLVCGFAAVSLIVRYFVIRKNLNMQWA